MAWTGRYTAPICVEDTEADVSNLAEARREAAELRGRAGPFRWFFRDTPAGVELWGEGETLNPFGRSFGIQPLFVPHHEVETSPTNPLIDSLERGELALRRMADDVYRHSPWAIWTHSQETFMSYLEQVDHAIDTYLGLSLQGISLGPDEWEGLLAETNLEPDEFGIVHYRGVSISRGVSGVKRIVGD